ncbi:MAG TPA: hypothetical protein VMV56_03325 [Williamwhitmania sp.]|nr:hypothetical protein [Williamwhitmania sp.]
MVEQFKNWMVALVVLLLPAELIQAQTTTPQLPSANTTTPKFKPSGKVWGYVFGDYYLKTHADSLNRGKTQYAGKLYPQNFNAFDFRRIYLGYSYNISENFSAELVLTHEGDVVDGNGDRMVYVKAANLRWKNIVHNNDLVIGQTATPIFAMMSEKVWGYRSIEKTVADMRGFGSSSDMGVAWQGKLDDKGSYGYNFMIGNGTAQKLENNRYKKFYGEVYAKLMDQKIILDLTSDHEISSPTQSKTTIKGFVAYQTDPITVGIEVVNQLQKNYKVDSVNGSQVNANVVPFAFSVFVKGQIIKNKLNFYARYDTYNPDTKYSRSDLYPKAKPYTVNLYTEKFFTGGLDFTPNKNVHFMPNIWLNTYKSKLDNVSGLAKSNYDMVLRLTFFVNFG